MLLVVVCWGWALLGAAALFWAAHSTLSSDAAAAAVAGALGVGYGGMYFTIVAYCVRRAEMGDW